MRRLLEEALDAPFLEEAFDLPFLEELREAARELAREREPALDPPREYFAAADAAEASVGVLDGFRLKACGDTDLILEGDLAFGDLDLEGLPLKSLSPAFLFRLSLRSGQNVEQMHRSMIKNTVSRPAAQAHDDDVHLSG